jgi:hypothetical protein
MMRNLFSTLSKRKSFPSDSQKKAPEQNPGRKQQNTKSQQIS